MALQLSRREVDDLRSSLDRAIYRTIGKSDSSLLSTVSSCLSSGDKDVKRSRHDEKEEKEDKKEEKKNGVEALAANIRAKRREEFRAQLSGAASVEGAGAGARWHDERVQARAPVRTRRPLRFHEPGKFTQMGDRLRMK
ncbi:hypothetical protein HF086_004526, partial [Spodoptera exigua]